MQNYQALARKWRPLHFQDFVGQQHIVKSLTNSIDKKNLHHAYLFSGTRGVGKTTLARIIAKCFSCIEGITSEPCGTCSNCVGITEGSFIDLVEVDGASKTKVEDTRELLDNLHFAPTVGRYKIYIIDEVHMLSKHSFNALLKTLEEPPSHVKFIFATTDVDKIPITILSRCLQFKLLSLSDELISNHLVNILNQEQLKYEDHAISLIAKAANGSLRDSLSILEQCIAFSNANLEAASVRQMLGLIKSEDIHDLFAAVVKGNAEQALEQAAVLASMAVDFNKVVDDFLSMLHGIAIAHAIQPSKQDEFIHAMQEITSPEDIQLLYQIALMGKQDLAQAPNQRIGFDMLVIRLTLFKPQASTPSIKTAKNQTKAALKPVNSPAKTNSDTTAKANNNHQIKAELKPVNSPVKTDSDATAKANNNHQIKAELKPVNSPVKTDSDATAKANNNHQIKAATAEITHKWYNLVSKLEIDGLHKMVLFNSMANNLDEIIDITVDKEFANLITPSLEQQLQEILSKALNSNSKLKVSTGMLIDSVASMAKNLKHKQQLEMQNDFIKDDIAKDITATLDAKLVQVVPNKDLN